MAELLSLPGRNALTPFRTQKLLSTLAGEQLAAGRAHGGYWHFVRDDASAEP